MDILVQYVNKVNQVLWGPPTLILMACTGAYLMHGLKYTPLSKIYSALSLLSKSNAAGSSKEDGDISPFSALMTAMSGVVGTGNIAGVATAITLGGPGALFYMCLMALIVWQRVSPKPCVPLNTEYKMLVEITAGGRCFTSVGV